MTFVAATGVETRLSRWTLFSHALVLCGVGHETKAGPPGDPELFTHDEMVQLYEQEVPRRHRHSSYSAPMRDRRSRFDKRCLGIERFDNVPAKDWILVKPPALTDPYDRKQPNCFAPHFGRTLKSLNYGVADRVSDHDPMLVDLPFGNPDIP